MALKSGGQGHGADLGLSRSAAGKGGAGVGSLAQVQMVGGSAGSISGLGKSSLSMQVASRSFFNKTGGHQTQAVGGSNASKYLGIGGGSSCATVIGGTSTDMIGRDSPMF